MVNNINNTCRMISYQNEMLNMDNIGKTKEIVDLKQELTNTKQELSDFKNEARNIFGIIMNGFNKRNNTKPLDPETIDIEA